MLSNRVMKEHAFVLILAVFTGCGRMGFSDEAAEPGPDAAGSLALTGCWSAWRTGPTLAKPGRIDEVLNGTRLTNPSFSPDRLHLYYVEYSSPATAGDLMMATRLEVGATWSNIGPVTELTSVDEEGRMSVSGDELTTVFARYVGGQSTLWQATRDLPDAPFESPKPVMAPGPDSKFDPELTADGLRLYYSESGLIYMATRARRTDSFSNSRAIEIGPIAGAKGTFDPTLSPDERVMVFSTAPTSGDGSSRDLYYVVRDDAASEFGPPIALSGVNTTSDEGDSDLSSDGCELVYSRTPQSNRELWVTHVIM